MDMVSELFVEPDLGSVSSPQHWPSQGSEFARLRRLLLLTTSPSPHSSSAGSNAKKVFLCTSFASTMRLRSSAAELILEGA
jgi:hypothetical protein